MNSIPRCPSRHQHVQAVTSFEVVGPQMSQFTLRSLLCAPFSKSRMRQFASQPNRYLYAASTTKATNNQIPTRYKKMRTPVLVAHLH